MSPVPTIGLIDPSPQATRAGNRVTALRWAGLLRQLGCRVFRQAAWDGRACDALIALHAEKSAPSIHRFRDARGDDAALVVACTGTDIYGDGADRTVVRASLARARRIVVLQALAPDELDPALRDRARVIHQSVSWRPARRAPDDDAFTVAVIAHLRAVKDPLRAAHAARRLPPGSRVRIVLVGAALDPDLGEVARAEARANARFTWLGALPRRRALEFLAQSHLCVSSSAHEGGSNAVTEALAVGTPVLASAISGSIGLLGAGYPGTFPAGDTEALAGLLARAESDAAFLADLERGCRARAFLTEPHRERDSWRALLAELGIDLPARGRAKEPTP